jgi:hypothetical protein
MRLLKVFGFLALLTLASQAVFLFFTGPISRHDSNALLETMRMLGEVVWGIPLKIFLASALVAGVVDVTTRDDDRPYPGLVSGAVVILLATGVLTLIDWFSDLRLAP